VTGVKPGDEVFGIGNGSSAEYARARTGKLAPKPATLFFDQAAAVPISGLYRPPSRARPWASPGGQQVLIIGASGGVGSFAVQIERPHFARRAAPAEPADQSRSHGMHAALVVGSLFAFGAWMAQAWNLSMEEWFRLRNELLGEFRPLLAPPSQLTAAHLR